MYGRLLLVYQLVVLLFVIVLHSCMCSYEDHSEELCRYNRHTSGQWVKYKNKKASQRNKSFPCCGVLDNDYLWNEDVCGHVKGISPLNFTGINDKPMGAFDRACNQEKLRNERLNVSLVESYVWEPFFCNLVRWDGVRFCQLLGNLNYTSS